MIVIKHKDAIEKMASTAHALQEVFFEVKKHIEAGVSTLHLNDIIEKGLCSRKLVSQSKGYMGYKHASCISINDEVVHGVPSPENLLKTGDLVKIDVCVKRDGYCADMARMFVVGELVDKKIERFMKTAQLALDKGIECARVGNRLSDISIAIQNEVEKQNFGIVRDFAGHGIGQSMHEDPEVLNYGVAGKGPILRKGMTLAIEPMITMGNYDVYVANDGWTVRTVDKSLAAHVEDTIVITDENPIVLTRM